MSEKYKFSNPEGVYFITATIMHWIDVFTRSYQKHVVVESLNHCIKDKGLVVYAWCIMSNHIHLICSSNNGNISGIIRDFKRYTSIKIIEKIQNEPESRREWMLNAFGQAAQKIKRNKRFKVWQDGCHPIELVSNEMIEQRLEYIHNNPVHEEIVDESIHYIYSSAQDYAGIKGYVNIELID